MTLIADGHSSAVYGTLTGPQMIAHHNEVLGSFFAKVKPEPEAPRPKAQEHAHAHH